MYKKNENISYLRSCKICGNDKLKKVIKLNEQYISTAFVKSNKENETSSGNNYIFRFVLRNWNRRIQFMFPF